MNADVIVIGGGVSGLAAAVRLSGHGARVVLLEQSTKLGGRCYSFRDEATGDVVDNGQHVLVGAYRHTLSYLEAIGTHHCLRRENCIPLFLEGQGISALRMLPLPPPLHLLAGIFSYRHLALRDRLGSVRVGLFLKRWDARAEQELSGISVEAWLARLGQTARARQALWDPICISVMNEHPERASALLFARALRSTFLGNASDAQILIPTVGQTELYVEPARTYLETRGSTVLSGTEAFALEVSDCKVTGVRLADGRSISSPRVIAAIPPPALARILPEGSARKAPFDRLGGFDSSPIISIHLWFDREVLGESFVGLVGRDMQWFFDRRRIVGAGRTPGYVSGVISAAYGYVDRPREELIAIALHDLGLVAAPSREARLLGSMVIKEKRATFSATGAADAVRPPAKTPIGGFFLAGDWTATGYPATIEGAILSGHRAAELAARRDAL